MKKVFYSLQLLVRNRTSRLVFVFFLLALLAWEFFLVDYALIRGNMGLLWVWLFAGTHVLLSLLFALFVSAQIYKLSLFFQLDIKKSGIGLVAAFLWGIVWWCPSCTLGIVSALGIGAFLSFLPGYGIELKILGILVLVWVNYRTLRDLTICHKKT